MTPLFHNPGLVIADRWQRDFPLCDRPFAALGAAHDLTERETLEALAALRRSGMLSRIGAVVRPNAAGTSTLAALACRPGEIEEIAAMVSAEPFVNHNYERDHAINLWFVVAAPSPAELSATLARIAQRSGREVLDLRLERPFHIDLGFGLGRRAPKPAGGGIALRPATAGERELLAALDEGLPLTPRPYAAIATRLGATGSRVVGLISAMARDGIVARFGCVIRHRSVGFTANAMAVWDVPTAAAGALGQRLAREEGVTLCYLRNRWPGAWPYNLFAMVHGREPAAVRRRIGEIAAETGLAQYPADILFSRRCFMQRGARFGAAEREAA